MTRLTSWITDHLTGIALTLLAASLAVLFGQAAAALIAHAASMFARR